MWLMRSVRGSSSSSASTRRHFLSKVLNQLQVHFQCAWLGRDQTENARPRFTRAIAARAAVYHPVLCYPVLRGGPFLTCI